ncbi:MAG: alpha/beta hydrolase [Alphaproteobacteria bacterium]|nr:alpha/beta hydrolase [Alphaproteobacteria bacterium]HPF47265.1 alpha/beta hydrolase-fold protein [Emcibacteraceae bacterium]HRW29257.1 alpha/beta hydrolase-fold protein [Emcibacteraceae bacterium]
MIKKYILPLFIVSVIFPLQSALPQSRLSIGDRHHLYSNILEQDREILVGLPRDYTENEQYPVLYLLDGGKYYQMAQGLLDFLQESAGKIPKVILVAIPNVYRNTDLTPVYQSDDPNAIMVENGGGADKFLEFIKSELKPFIEDRYSTSGNDILFGHSLAGLFAAYSFLEEPGLFENYILSDPSLWYGESMVVNKLAINKFNFFSAEKNFFLTQIDRSQDEEDIMTGPQEKFLAELKGLPKVKFGKSLIEGENHSSMPLKSLYQGLLYIFKDYDSKK